MTHNVACRCFVAVVLVAALRAWPGAASVAWAADPAVKRTEAFIEAFKKVKSGDNLSAAEKKANQRAFAALDGFFDFGTLTSRPLQPVAAKFSANQ